MNASERKATGLKSEAFAFFRWACVTYPNTVYYVTQNAYGIVAVLYNAAHIREWSRRKVGMLG